MAAVAITKAYNISEYPKYFDGIEEDSVIDDIINCFNAVKVQDGQYRTKLPETVTEFLKLDFNTPNFNNLNNSGKLILGEIKRLLMPYGPFDFSLLHPLYW